MKGKITLAVVLTCLVLLSGCMTSQRLPQLPDGALPWSASRPITWSDFRGTPIESSSGTVCQIFIENPAFFDRSSLFSKVNVVSSCYMDRRHSWVDTTRATRQFLLYDQTIFDIYELYTRKFRQRIDTTSFGVTDVSPEFNNAYQKNENKLLSTLKQFETETKLGADASAIEQWHLDVRREIAGLAKFGSN